MFADDLIGGCKIELGYCMDHIDDYGLAYCESKKEASEGIIKVVTSYLDKTKNNEDTKLDDRVALFEECIKRAKTDKEFAKQFINSVTS